MGHPYKYPVKNIPLGCLWNYVNLRTFLGKFIEFIAKYMWKLCGFGSKKYGTKR